MYIVHLTSELSPIAKVGGLGDVVSGLSKALLAKGEKVEVILPFYSHIDRTKLQNLKIEYDALKSYEDLEEKQNTIYTATFDGIPLILIEPSLKTPYFNRGAIYGEKDDQYRFTYFTKTAMEYLLKAKKHPDILNFHDWLTALAAPIYTHMYKDLGLEIGKIVTTIHNMKYQGVCSVENLERLGINPAPLQNKDSMQDPTKAEKLNLLKGALVYSDIITTVSPTYAKEIQGKEGFGLEPLLITTKETLHGILNGIDTSYWNPKTDPFLTHNYSAQNEAITVAIKAKTGNKKSLQKKLKMSPHEGPLFISVSRLVDQKGPEMIMFGIEYVLEKGGQFVLLGSTPEPKLEQSFLNLAKKYEDNPNVHFHFVFDEPLAHLTFSAADSILIPSLFEPCGLTQMISLRYGTIPIVHQVGGLNDTVFDIQNEDIPLEKRNGYTFDFPSNESLRWAIDRAFKDYQDSPKKWETMMKNGFAHDWSWNAPAQEYLRVCKES